MCAMTLLRGQKATLDFGLPWLVETKFLFKAATPGQLPHQLPDPPLSTSHLTGELLAFRIHAAKSASHGLWTLKLRASNLSYFSSPYRQYLIDFELLACVIRKMKL